MSKIFIGISNEVRKSFAKVEKTVRGIKFLKFAPTKIELGMPSSKDVRHMTTRENPTFVLIMRQKESLRNET